MSTREDVDRPVDEHDLETSSGDNGLELVEAEPEVDTPALDAPEEQVPPPLAEFTELVKRYGEHRALGPLSLTLERGCVGLLGPNGAGKSTLIRLMMGLLGPTHGSLKVLGDDVRPGARSLRRRIGYVPEGPAVFPGLTGVESVVYAGQLVGMPKTAAVERAHHVLDYVGLGEARYRDVSTYSTGMRQRLKIAQALVHDPELLILDEPTEGVDPEAREAILKLVSELVRTHGLQLIFSTHLLHDVERVATHVLILNEGQVVQHGPVGALLASTQRGYQVRIAGAPDALMARLDEDGVEHEWYPPDLRVRIDDPRRLLQLADEAGLVVRHIAPVELSLNEAFEAALTRGAPADMEQLWQGDDTAEPAPEAEEEVA